MIAGAGFGGAAEQWRAMGVLADQARTAASGDPRDVRIKELLEQVRAQTERALLAENRLKTREEGLDKANATVDDQAAQIVDLQAKLGLGRTADGSSERDRMNKMVKIENQLRANLERAEARASQLIAAWPGDSLPPEEAFFRKDGTDASY